MPASKLSDSAGEAAVSGASPRVFLDYDQAALDAAYNQAVYAPHSEHVRRRIASASREVHERLRPQRIAYGKGEQEKLDWYATDKAGAPVMLFIHGGAWRRGTARDNAFAAEVFLDAGVHFVVPDFVWVQDAQDSLRTIANQLRAATVCTLKKAAEIGADTSRLYLVGHSSGAHLGGVLLTTDWAAQWQLKSDVFRAATLCSGMYDLYPVSLSSRREYVPFDDDIVQTLSPQRHIDRLTAPVTLIYGTLETPEFQRQSRDFTDAVRRAGKQARLLEARDYNHFDLKETLANPYGVFGKAVLDMLASG